ncbi:hypothetical protein GCM10009780_63310 [Actinomadura alba]
MNEGNEDTLIALYDTYAERLYDYCVSLICDSKVAADTVHDCLIDACRRAPRLRDRMRLGAWLYGAARRRCLQRGRSGGLHWVWTSDSDCDATPAHDPLGTGAPGDEAAAEAEETDRSGLTLAERRELLELTLARLDFPEQEVLLLALRHDVTGYDLAATLGVSGRRAAARLARARAQAEAAMTAELRVLSWQGAGERRTGTPPTGKVQAEVAEQGDSGESDKTIIEPAGKSLPATPSAGEGSHPGGADLAGLAGLAGRRKDTGRPHSFGRSGRRGHDFRSYRSDRSDRSARGAGERRHQVSLTALLDLGQALAPPAALRRRVVHTGTDPELAGYRADIAGRGGNLTTQGLPRQPDVTPPFARRWMFAAGGMAGALITATVAVLLIGPDLPGPQFYWPTGPKPKTPSPPGPTQSMPNRMPASPPGSADPGGRPPVAAPQTEGRLKTPSPGPRTPSTPPQPGRLRLSATQVILGPGERETHLDLFASMGAVTWSAQASSPQLTLSATSGRISKNGRVRLGIEFDRALIQLQGEATVTINSTGGRSYSVAVSWAGSVLT